MKLGLNHFIFIMIFISCMPNDDGAITKSSAGDERWKKYQTKKADYKLIDIEVKKAVESAISTCNNTETSRMIDIKESYIEMYLGTNSDIHISEQEDTFKKLLIKDNKEKATIGGKLNIVMKSKASFLGNTDNPDDIVTTKFVGGYFEFLKINDQNLLESIEKFELQKGHILTEEEKTKILSDTSIPDYWDLILTNKFGIYVNDVLYKSPVEEDSDPNNLFYLMGGIDHYNGDHNYLDSGDKYPETLSDYIINLHGVIPLKDEEGKISDQYSVDLLAIWPTIDSLKPGDPNTVNIPIQGCVRKVETPENKD